MSFWAKLFSFEGRIGRGEWWTLSTLVFVVQVFAFVVVFQAFGGLPDPAAEIALGPDGKPTGPVPSEAGPAGLLYAIILAGVIGVWPNLAVSIKRWHDRDKGWQWHLINFIPWVGPLWATVELGFLSGTPGPNRFGAGPGMKESVADAFGEADDGDDRAAAAIARWQSDNRGAPTAPPPPREPARAPAWSAPAAAGPAPAYARAAAPAGFGKRTAAPTAW